MVLALIASWLIVLKRSNVFEFGASLNKDFEGYALRPLSRFPVKFRFDVANNASETFELNRHIRQLRWLKAPRPHRRTTARRGVVVIRDRARGVQHRWRQMAGASDSAQDRPLEKRQGGGV